jgi:hypothetical protein
MYNYIINLHIQASNTNKPQTLETRKNVIISSIDGNLKYCPWEFDLRSRTTGIGVLDICMYVCMYIFVFIYIYMYL